MTLTATAHIATEHAAKYLQQVCKHWAHNLPVAFDETHGTITFAKDARGADWPDDAQVTFDATADTLCCTITASAEGQRDGLKGAIERHVDRFAFREGPLAYHWIDG